MTTAVVVHSGLLDSFEAGTALGQEIVGVLSGERPDVVMLFASPRYEFSALLKAIDTACGPVLLVGSSSAGEFTSNGNWDGACAVALKAPEMRFHAAIGRNLSKDRSAAVRELTSRFQGAANPAFAHRSALIMTDALAGHADDLVEQLAALTGGTYRLFGGGAGGDAHFERRFVFCGTEAVADAVVALEILSNKPLGIGVRHGWKPNGKPLRVTEADGARLVSLNATAVVEVFEEHAARTGQRFDRKEPLPFFLHNVLGVDTAEGHRLRVPLAINADGSITCATEIPEGATVRVMGVASATVCRAAEESATDALRQIGEHKPAVALFFDCVATRLRMGDEFRFELDAVQRALGDTKFAGCNSIGQIARADGQFSGFHNCTAVVCVIPE